MCSVLFFVLGFLCRHFCYKPKKSVETVPPLEETSNPGPLYEDVQPRRKEDVLELETNVAYGPVNRK